MNAQTSFYADRRFFAVTKATKNISTQALENGDIENLLNAVDELIKAQKVGDSNPFKTVLAMKKLTDIRKSLSA